MTASLLVPAALGDWSGGRRELTVEGATVGAVLDSLAATMPALERRVRDEQGEVRRHVQVFVGETNIRDASGLDTPVPEGARMAIVPAVSGG